MALRPWKDAALSRIGPLGRVVRKPVNAIPGFLGSKVNGRINFLVWKWFSLLIFRVVWDCSSSKLKGRQYKQKTLNEKNTNAGLPYSGFNWRTRCRWVTQCPQAQSSKIRKKFTSCIRLSELRGTYCFSANVLHIRCTTLLLILANIGFANSKAPSSTHTAFDLTPKHLTFSVP